MTTTTLIPQILTKITDYKNKTPKTKTTTTFYNPTKSPQYSFNRRRRYVCCCYHHHRKGFNFDSFNPTTTNLLFSDEITKKNKRVVLVRFNNLGFNGGGGGGGDDGGRGRVLGNLALAIGLSYLSFTGQLGWVLDAIVSVWVMLSFWLSVWIKLSLLVVLVPIVGLGVLIWWAGRDMVQSECPNCGNEFQLLKSTLNDEAQQCPYCSQPFFVVGDEFVRDPVKFSNGSTTFGDAFNDLSSRSKKGTSC
ncbi:hypothetical protein OSB04_007926 [Centaurea solstitialis]|uniref:Uncharacterized protein n=1 Tax=Centaurea solstitialis TaxID=347529 RepID=A0AA38TWB1_9ASTR|nr:hypothetical protein OSB04_007926 [Centaurea solstitialis]